MSQPTPTPTRAEQSGDPTTPIAVYYDDTLVDYDAWSREGFLHFGYWRLGLNPLSRKPMLEEMNRLIFKHLGLAEMQQGTIADLGCGVGAVSRFGSELYPQLDFRAVTISSGQVASAHRRHADQRVSYHCCDYHQLPFEDATVDRIFYLESLCHSTRPDQALTEAARVLKPGGRIVMTDGFLQRPFDASSAAFRHIVSGVAHNWAVPMFHEIAAARQWQGGGSLRLIKETECGWRLGPSALHAAHLSVIQFAKLSLSRKATRWQWKHLTASAYTILLGLYRRNFRYYLLVFDRVSL